MYTDEQIEKAYDYITHVFQIQNKPIPFSLIYGDGTIFNGNRIMAYAVYMEVLNVLGWKEVK